MKAPTPSISVALAGSGGAGVMTAGNMLLEAAAQAGYYSDDGCGEPLDLWFTRPPVKLPPPDAPQVPYRPKLPSACASLLKAP